MIVTKRTSGKSTMVLLKFGLILFMSLSLPFTANTSPSNINILSWWGYINTKQIKDLAQKKCGVGISIDEYYSSSEMIRRFEKNTSKYDLLIFANTTYSMIKDKVPSITVKGSQIVDQYLLPIRAIYNKKNYPSNIRFFMHAFTGFLVNSKNSNFNQSSKLSEIFKLGTDTTLVLIDDPIEIQMLLSRANLKLSELIELSKKQKLLISNNIDRVSQTDKFGIAYVWSGAAIDNIKSSNSLKFLVHPKLSHITSDLIALMSKKKEGKCVFDVLTSKEVLNLIAEETKYFPSFGLPLNFSNYSSLPDLSKIKWIDSPSREEIHTLNREWKRVKSIILTNTRKRQNEQKK